MNKLTRLVKLEAKLNPPPMPLIIIYTAEDGLSDEQLAQIIEAEGIGQELKLIRIVDAVAPRID